MKIRTILFFIGLVTAFAALTESIQAAPEKTFVVDNTADRPDTNPGDGKCETKVNTCTLRAAVMEANALVGKDNVRLASTTYTLTRAGLEDNALNGDLDIKQDLVLSGPLFGQTIIDANNLDDRAVTIFEGVTATISNVTIRDALGGAIWNRGTLKLSRSTLRNNGKEGVGGGGLLNWGTATVAFSTLRNNKAFQGGGIYSHGTLTVKNSILHDNAALGLPSGTQDPSGGGLWNSGTTNIMNTTISTNRTDGYGGGIYNWGYDLDVRYSTIVYNKAENDLQYGGDGGGIRVEAGSVVVYNTILANNTRKRYRFPAPVKDDCKAPNNTFIVYGSLVEEPSGCAVPTYDNKTGIDPQLEPLANNGGRTLTHALKPDSPAIDPAYSCAGGSAALQDQRNYTRPVDGDGNRVVRCDMGAFEYGGTPRR
jgi:CSLREA domain-containing protein